MKASNSTTQNPIVKIAKPCHEKWSEMSTTEKGKFCDVCTKEVIDFTSNSNTEIAQHLQQAEGSVCGRLYSSQVITNPEVSKVQYFFQKAKTYLATLLAIISVSAVFGEKANAQMNYPIKGKMKYNPIPEQNTANQRETTIRGTVTLDNTQKPVTKCRIAVSSAGEEIDETLTNKQGQFQVKLPAGTMQNEEVSIIAAATGYVEKTIEELKILKEEINLNFSLQEELMEMGDVMYVPEEHIKMGEVAIPETIEEPIKVNELDVRICDLKIIETPPATIVDVLSNEKPELNTEGNQPVNNDDAIMFLGQMVMIEHEPIPEDNIADELDNILMGDTVLSVLPQTPINDQPEVTVEGLMEIVDPEPVADVNPVQQPELTNFIINDDNTIDPVQQVQISEPLALINPIWPIEKQKVGKIRKIRKILNLQKMEIINPEIIVNEEEVVNMVANEGATLIESPELGTERNGEGTQEPLEPITDTKMILSVYPNPSTDYFNVELSGDSQFLLEMYDERGRQVKITKLDAALTRVETSTMEPGTYLVRISNSMGDKVETKTIVVL